MALRTRLATAPGTPFGTLFVVPHPFVSTAPLLRGPLVGDDLFRRLCRSRDYLAAHLDQPLRLADGAREACLSPFHYHRLFTRAFDETPHEFITRLRIDRARYLLARDQLSITEVCFALGYQSLGTFSERFRTMVGSSPASYRRALRRIFPVPELIIYRFIPACFLEHWGASPF